MQVSCMDHTTQNIPCCIFCLSPFAVSAFLTDAVHARTRTEVWAKEPNERKVPGAQTRSLSFIDM